MSMDARLEHERANLQADYEARRGAMLRLALMMGAVVVLSLLAMFAVILSLNSAIGDVHKTQVSGHSCTVALLQEVIEGGHNTHPPGCPR